MLVADAETNPYFKELSAAAKEIAELKNKVTKLERLIDGIVAQHLAGAEPMMCVAGEVDSVDAPVDIPFPTEDELGVSALACAYPAAACPAECSADNEQCTHPSHCERPALDAAPDTEAGTLPAAVRSLICRPTKAALTATDDLTLIKGIDCTTALELAALDLNQFGKIATLDAQGVADLQAAVDQASQIHKDNWIEQAALLADGNLTSYAREVTDTRDGESTENTDAIQAETIDVLEAAASEIQVDPLFEFDALSNDTAESTLQDLAQRDLPRAISIEWPATSLMHTPDNTTSFIPMAAADAGFAVKKIAHVTPSKSRDRGNLRALTASLAAAAVVYIVSANAGLISFDMSLAQVIQTDVCQLSGLSAFPDACKQFLAPFSS